MQLPRWMQSGEQSPRTHRRSIIQVTAGAVALSMVCGLPAYADQPAAPAAQTAATTTAPSETAAAADFADVPADHWATEAIKELAADGYIKGYPDGTFKGARPMTRYEAAALIARAVTGLKDAIAANQQVEQKDIDALKKLLAAFGDQVKDVQARVAALEKKTDSLQAQATAVKAEADATQYLANRQRVGIDFTMRPGVYSQNAFVRTGSGSVEPAGVAANSQIPAYKGTSTTAPGSNTGTNYAAWEGNALPVGAVNHGTDYLLARFSIGGTFAPWMYYGVRFKEQTRLEAGNGTTTTTPAYCSAVTGIATTAAGCSGLNITGSGSNIPASFDLAYVGYQSKGGIYAQAGRFLSTAEGYYNVISMIFGGQSFQGGEIGYADTKRIFQFNALYGIPGLSSYSQAVANGGPATSNTCSAVIGLNVGTYGAYGVNPGCNTTQQELGLQGSYYVRKTRTAFGAAYDGFIGLPLSVFNPNATLCGNSSTLIAGVTGIPAVTGAACGAVGSTAVAAAQPGAYLTEQVNVQVVDAFISQYFGRRGSPQFNLAAEYGRRLGHDPYSGQLWNSPSAGAIFLTYGSKSNLYAGSPVPFISGVGTKDSNNVQLFVEQFGLNSIGGIESGYSATVVPTNNLGITNPNGTRTYGFEYAHWFSDFFRLGIIALNVGLTPGTTIPVGSLTTCQGCQLTSLRMNQVELDSTLVLR